MITLGGSRNDLISILNPYIVSLSEVGIRFNAEETLYLCEKILEHYKGYHATYDIMDLKALDDFKVIAWAPYLICEIVDTSEEDKKLIISAAVEMLHGFVQARGNRVNPYWLDKVTDVAFKGFFDASTPYSIAKVGLYTSFKTAAKTSSTGKSAIKELALVHSAIEVARVLFGVVI